jgi:hypothetical protein
MDLGAYAGHSTVTSNTCQTSGPDKVVCEQAVYTCVCTASSKGYRIIAASSGLPPHECGEILRCTPGVGGLCVDSPEAVGTSFFHLGDGRYAVLHTCHAGKEPTGRGGRRTYTRIIVVEADGLRRFKNNPFALVRAAAAAGMLAVDLKTDVTLSQMILAPEWGHASPGFEFAGSSVSEKWIAHVCDCLLLGKPAVVSAGVEIQAMTELILLAVPAPMRPEISFSEGVTFSVSRPHRLIVLANVESQTRDRITGTDYVFLDSADDPSTAPAPAHPWARTIGRFIETRRTASLVGMLADRFSEGDVKALDRLGELCLALDSAASSDLDNLIGVAMPYVGINAELPLERELARQVVRLVRHRFSSLISHATCEQLSAVWHRMLSAEPRSSEAARLVEESAALAVTRMSCLDPVAAMGMILETKEATAADHAATDLDYARQTVVTCVGGWVTQAPVEDLAPALPVLEAWCQQHPEDAGAAESLNVLRARIAEAAQPGEAGEPVEAVAASE